ncbi:transmembrane protein 91-like [Scleropages formosus]|uniref:Synapse differentiation-inducing gene protein 1-like n=1 Tax=Scleropages formosus TaxID=113540 RepID=A0A0P7XXA4_SCLFO|nr:synapse differentiation-inducing gene protein 1-like [Scleropages formosus]KPP57557.1 transmembrane protein 91-like [Scleropages formosus]
MESVDELEELLLPGSPGETKGPAGVTANGSPLFEGKPLAGKEKMLPPVSWRRYCSAGALDQQQLLDAQSLPCKLEALYPLPPAWGVRDAVGPQRKSYLETSFMGITPGCALERKLLGNARDVHSLGCCVLDEDDLLPEREDSSSEDLSESESESNFSLMIPQDYLGLAVFSMLCCFWPLGILAFYLSQKTNKASAQGDFRRATSASRQALWLAVLSIIFGIITYICAVAALISYLSGKAP